MSRRPSRMEQLGNLLTAMIAVIVSGQSETVLEAKRPAPNPRLAHIDMRDFQRGRPFWGLQAKVARDLTVSTSEVRNVLAGRTRSAVVESAILRAADAALLLPEVPKVAKDKSLTAAEQCEFKRGGKYFGLYTRTARRLRMSDVAVRMAALGEAYVPGVMTALREEMKARDENPLPDQLTDFEISLFSVGGRYCGAFARAAKQLGVHRTVIGVRIRAKKADPETLAAVRHAMTEIDHAREAAK